MSAAYVINTPAASCARGLDVDGINTCNGDSLRPWHLDLVLPPHWA